MSISSAQTITYISADLSPKRQRSELLGKEITELYSQSAWMVCRTLTGDCGLTFSGI